MNQMRRYMLLLTTYSEKSLSDFHIPESVSEYAQGIFIQVRKGEHEASGGEVKTTAETFHQWLTLARLVAVSEGILELTKELFDRARDLEIKRIAKVGLANVKK